MPGPSLELEMRLKDQKLQVALDALAAKEDKVDTNLAKIARTARTTSDQLDRFARRTTEINSTPLEKYNRQLFLLDTAFRRGKISQDTYTAAVQRARTQLDAVGQEQEQALRPSFLGQIQTFAAGYLTLHTAVNLVADAFRHARQESEAALGSLRSHDEQRRKLVQLAESPEDLAAMLKRADEAAKASGVDRGTAYDVLFQARSFGFEQDFEQILGANEVIRADAGAQLAGKVATMFGGKITGRQAINMALAAGKPSEVDAESIAGSLALALEGGRRVGATPDETFAWVSALSAAFKNPQVAADRIKAITNRAANTPELRTAGGMTEIMKRLQAMSPEDRAEILKGDQETNAAYEAMVEFSAKQQEIEQAVRAARVGTGTANDPLAIGRRIAAATPQTRASLLSRQAEIGKEFAREEQLAGPEAERTAAISAVEQAAHRSRVGMFGRFGISLFGRAAKFLGLGPELSGGLAAAGKEAGEDFLPRLAGGGLNGMLVSMLQRVLSEERGFSREAVRLLREIRDDTRGGNQTARGRAIQNEALQPLN